MLRKVPAPERMRLGFGEAVLSSFKFLFDLGFRSVEEMPTFVRYESPNVFVNVYHGRGSFEMGVEIGRLKGPPEEGLGLRDILAWAGAERVEGFGQHVMFQASSPEGVKNIVPRLAGLVRRYALPFLKDDGACYRNALEIRSRAAAKYVDQVNLRRVRVRAEAAWHAKDYARVAELYGRVRKDLTGIESKRLAYAERRVLAGEGAVLRPLSRRSR